MNNSQRRWNRLRLSAWAAPAVWALLGAAYCGATVAQTTNDDFDVTVEPSPSQQGVVAQGPSSLNAATLQLRSLRQITDAVRDERHHGPRKSEPTTKQAYAALASLVNLIAPAAGPGGAEVGSAFTRLNTFANVDYAFGDRDRSANSPGYDIDTLSVIAGADYRLNPDLVVGAALGYVDNKSDFASGLGRLEQDGISAALLANWYASEFWYFDGIARYGSNDYSTIRPLPGGGNARGETDGDEYSLSVGTGYEFNFGALNLGPRARLTYTDANIDGYRERATTNGLTYDDQDVESLSTNVGGEATYALNTAYGVLVPQADFEWVHEFKDSARTIVARSNAGGAPFGVPVDPLDSDFFRLGLNATAILPRGVIVFLRYEIELGRDDTQTQGLTLGARLELGQF